MVLHMYNNISTTYTSADNLWLEKESVTVLHACMHAHTPCLSVSNDELSLSPPDGDQ